MTLSPNLLPHTCTIETADTGAIDADGFTQDGTWTATYTSVPCRFYSYQQGREIYREKEIVIADFVIDLLASQAITEEMRVSAVTGSDGSSIQEAATFQVASVRTVSDGAGVPHHKVAYLRLVR